MIIQSERRYLLDSIVVCFFCAIFSFGIFILQSEGFFLITDDFNVQQIPFTTALYHALKGNVGGWTWNYDLGVSTIQGFSFYALGSPFFWCSRLFPDKWFPYLVGFLYVFKYMVAGATSYLYLERFTKQAKNAVIGAVLYSFSGFQTTNLEFYHFHDVVALFPLLLLGLEILAEAPQKRHVLIFAVFINCLTNYYFFVPEVIFLVLYFCFRFFGREKIDVLLKRIGNCLLCGVWGCAMAALLFIPNALYMLSSPRLSSKATRLSIIGGPRTTLLLIKGFLFPGEAMNSHSCVVQTDWSSTACYLPFLGLSLVLSFLLKQKNWLSRLIILLIVISFSPLLSSGFLLFSEANRRWWFMLSLMMALASVLVLEDPCVYPVKKGTLINMLLLVGFIICVVFLSLSSWAVPILAGWNIYILSDKTVFTCYCLIVIISLLVMLRLVQKKRLKFEIVLLPTCIVAILTTVATLYVYRTTCNQRETREALEVGMELRSQDPQYRFASCNNCNMLMGDAAGTGVFSSTRSLGSVEFDALFDYKSTNTSLNKDTVPGLEELLAGKYIIRKGEDSGDSLQVIQVNGEIYSVQEQSACPIGFSINHYLLYEDLMDLPVSKRGIALLNAVVLEEQQVKQVKANISHFDTDMLQAESAIETIVNNNSANAVSSFSRDTNGFTCQTDYCEDRVIFFSVPYDQGWKAYIDSKEVHILDSGGMMLIEVPSGFHEIRFEYRTPGYLLGAVISVISISLFLINSAYYFWQKHTISGRFVLDATTRRKQ